MRVTLKQLKAARAAYRNAPFGKANSKERAENWRLMMAYCTLVRNAPRSITAKLVN